MMSENSGIELKPCPFCGSEMILIGHDGHDNGIHYAHCWDCGVSTNNFDTEERAAEAWNRRVQDV